MAKQASLKTKAIFALIGTAACFSLFSISARLVSPGFHPVTQVALRISLGFFFTLLLLGKSVRWSIFLKLSSRDWLLMLIMGAIGYSLNTYLATIAALHAPLVNISIIGNTIIFFVYIYSLILMMEKFSVATSLLALISFWGITIVATHSLIPTLHGFGIGELYQVGYAATGAMFIIARQQMSTKLSTQEVTVGVITIATITAIILALFSREPFTFNGFSNTQVLCGLLLGGIVNVVVMVLQNFAYKHINAVVATQILFSGTLFAMLYGFLFYKEIPSYSAIIGGIIVVSSAYVTNRLSKRSQ